MISVIIPVRNAGAYIRQCLESVARQEIDLEHYEVLISDNCSTDDTVSVVERFLGEADRKNFRLIRQEENLGAYGNLNFLLREAAFDHVHILCADDFYSSPESLSKILEATTKHPEVAIFAFDNDTCHADHSHWRTIDLLAGTEPLSGEQGVKFLFAFGCFLGGLSNIGLNLNRLPVDIAFNPQYRYFGDVDLYARAAIGDGSICIIREEVTARRHHGDSISSTANRDNICTHESVSTISRLERAILASGYRSWPLRAYASWLITQYYHASFKSILRRQGITSLRNVLRAHQGQPEFWPAWALVPLALANWFPFIRRPLHCRIESAMIRHLFQPQSQR